MSATMTTKFRLVEVQLGRDLAQYLTTERSAGQSLREIAAELSTRTGVDVSYESVRVWLNEKAAS